MARTNDLDYKKERYGGFIPHDAFFFLCRQQLNPVHIDPVDLVELSREKLEIIVEKTYSRMARKLQTGFNVIAKVGVGPH